MKLTLLSATLCLSLSLRAQFPELTSWILNPGTETGYNGIPSNCQLIQYNDNYVYVTCTCIPGYDIGPWAGNPNEPANQDFVFRITRDPEENTGTDVSTPLGHMGVWINGVSMFNPKDAFSYNNMGIWNQNAIIVEGISFDDCLGHPAPNGEYHTHLNPPCVYDDTDDEYHSPLIGFAFDGFPVYGAWAFDNTDGTGNIVRMESSYELRNITQRHTLPDGTSLSAGQYGPDVTDNYPLGYYIEDYQYTTGLGHLDEHNGRWCITPEYPEGTYCYFVTIDENLDGVYPYILGPTYYGTVPSGNTGPQSGHNTVPGDAQEWTGINASDTTPFAAIFPQSDHWQLSQSLIWQLFDMRGSLISTGFGNNIAYPEAKGYYVVRISDGHVTQCISVNR